MKKLFIILSVLIIFKANVLLAENDKDKAEWTILVFMNGGRSFEPFAERDINEMKKIGSSEKVNVVALFECFDKPSKLLYIKKNSYDVLKSYSNLNAGDYNVLLNFFKESCERYPARKYMLVMWRHGQVWTMRGKGGSRYYDEISQSQKTGIKISINEFSIVLKQIADLIGHKIDVLGMDINMMQKYEYWLNFKDYVNYYIASEESVPGNGWCYDIILKKIIDNPKVSPKELSSLIVNSYKENYINTQSATLSAIDLNNFEEANSHLNKISFELIEMLKNPQMNILIKRAINSVQRYANEDYCDLVDFCDKLIYEFKKQNIKNKSEIFENLKEVITDKLVTDKCVCNTGVKNSHGVAIYLPLSNVNDGYKKLDAYKLKWSEFIEAVLKK
jgi:hypothetical protein